jgi:hypothetical protein
MEIHTAMRITNITSEECGSDGSAETSVKKTVMSFAVLPQRHALCEEESLQGHRRWKASSRIENPRDLARSFAFAVTAENSAPDGWIAKNGSASIFRTLQRMLPEVIPVPR